MNPSLEELAAAAKGALQRHRRLATGVALFALAGFGITAVAVAPLANDGELPALRVVQEPLEALGLPDQLDALASHSFTLDRSAVTRGSEGADALLQRLGIQDVEAAAFLRRDTVARRLWTGRMGKMLQARTDTEGRLVELVARFPAEDTALARTHFTRLRVTREDDKLVARVQTAKLGVLPRMLGGTIRSSLFAATDEAGIPDGVASQLVDLFSSDIDFHRELRRGDTFRVVYETLFADGQPVAWGDGVGRVLAAEFVNGGRAHHAIWFAGAGGRGEYFGADGHSKREAFLASPLEFSRVTSGFTMRMHPLQRQWRAHLGVDYAAPRGTAVRAVGDAVVEFAGVRGGYGNVVELTHGKSQSTIYAHLNAIRVKPGQHVEQGQVIGEVGSTGWATGPHLHFEFRVNGVHQDPLKVARANSESRELDAAGRRRFEDYARTMNAKLDIAQSLIGARHTVE